MGRNGGRNGRCERRDEHVHVCVETGLSVCVCGDGCVCVFVHMWRDAVCVEEEVCMCVCVLRDRGVNVHGEIGLCVFLE